MSHTWIKTMDGDLLRADELRQITVVDGLRVVLTSGAQFLLADIDGRDACAALAMELVAAMAKAHPSETAVVLTVSETAEGWTVQTAQL